MYFLNQFHMHDSSYGAPDKDGRITCLKIFFLISLAAGVALIVVGLACILSPDSIESFLIEGIDDVTDGIESDLLDDIKDVAKNVNVIGAIAIVCGVIVLLGFVSCCYLMGFDFFIKVCSLKIYNYYKYYNLTLKMFLNVRVAFSWDQLLLLL